MLAFLFLLSKMVNLTAVHSKIITNRHILHFHVFQRHCRLLSGRIINNSNGLVIP